MTDDEQGLREPSANAGDARHEASRDDRKGRGGDGEEPEDKRVLIEDESVAQQADEDAPEGDTSGDGEKAPDKKGKKKKQGSFWKELPILIGVALVLALVIKAFAVQAFYIPSQSMENTLKVGDRVLVNKIVYHTRDIKRGDIVVFNGLDSWDPEVQYSKPTNPVSKVLRAVGSAFGVVPGEKDYIKRVIGVPGDTVACAGPGKPVTVNGRPLQESDYLFRGSESGQPNKPSDTKFKMTVPPGHLWVMGDHREVSFDSRGHIGDPGGGTIPESRVIGRAFVVVWPVSRMKTLPIPDTFKQPGLSMAHYAVPAVPVAMGLVGTIPVGLIRRRKRLRRAA